MLSLRLEGIVKSFPLPRAEDRDPAAIPGAGALRRLGSLLGGRGQVLPNRPPSPTGSVRALRGVDLYVPPGQTLSILGPSGCGKTTILRIVAGLEAPDAGKVFFGERDVTALPPTARGVGMVFQDYALYPQMEGRENLAFYFRVHHREDEIEERVRVTAALLGVGFAELLDKKPPVLSKGQQQRVAIGRCIVRDPTVFLFDEPMSNVDARVREQTRVLIKRLLRRFAVTSLYVTHDQTEAVTLGDRLAVMREGGIEQVGSFEELLARPANLFVAAFLGLPPTSFFPGRREGDGLRLASGDLISLPAPLGTLATEGEGLTLGVRAKDVRLSEPAGGEGLLGVVEVVEALPGQQHYKSVQLRVAGQLCHAQAPRDWPLKPGYVVRLEFDPAALYLFAADGRRLWPGEGW